MRRLTQRLSALIVIGLCIAALVVAMQGAFGVGQRLKGMAGASDSASAAPLAVAASIAAELAGLRGPSNTEPLR